MAVFNPEFNTPDPSYLKYSKPSPEPEADKSTGIALEAVGKGIEGGAEIADAGFKGAIRKELDDRTDAAKTDFLSQLDQFQQQKPEVTPMPSGTGQVVGQQDTQDVTATPSNIPQDIRSGLQQLQNIQTAKDQSGKFRTTDLDANLTDILKDMRSRYPGYRDYIDQQGSSIIGYNPANKLISDKVAQLNEARSNQAKEQDFWEKKIVDSGFDGNQEMLAKFKQNGNITAVENWYAHNTQVDAKIKRDVAQFALSSAKDADVLSRATSLANTVATQTSVNNFANHRLIEGDSTSATSAEVQNKLLEISQHPEMRNAPALLNLGIQLQGLESYNTQATRIALMNTKTKDADGNVKTAYQVLGPNKVQEIIDNNIGMLYKTMHTQLNDQNVGLLNATKSMATNIVNERVLGVLQDPTLRNVAVNMAAANTLFPNLSPELIKNIWGGFTDASGKQTDYATEMLKLSSVQKTLGLTQTGGSNSAGPAGSVYTFQQAMGEQDKAQKLVGSSDPERAAAIKDILKLKTALTEKDPRAVDAGIVFFTDPANQSPMRKWLRDDYYDPSKGIVEGGTSTVASFHEPAIVKSIWDRAHNGNGLAWDNFKSWSDKNTIPSLTTMAQTWNVNEHQLANQKTLQGDMPSGTDHHFYYDTDTHQIGITDLKGKPMDIADTWRVNPDIFMVRNANILIKGLSNIANQEGSDPDAYIFRQLQRAGWAPESLDVKGKTHVSDSIMKSIVHSANPPKKEE